MLNCFKQILYLVSASAGEKVDVVDFKMFHTQGTLCGVVAALIQHRHFSNPERAEMRTTQSNVM
jgi:hypothetical protein